MRNDIGCIKGGCIKQYESSNEDIDDICRPTFRGDTPMKTLFQSNIAIPNFSQEFIYYIVVRLILEIEISSQCQSYFLLPFIKNFQSLIRQFQFDGIKSSSLLE